eukprot:SAG11_NODE_9646_length_892_cov_1.933165_1_plen_51_part_00
MSPCAPMSDRRRLEARIPRVINLVEFERSEGLISEGQFLDRGATGSYSQY